MSTKDWLIRTIPLFLVLGLLFGWHDWSDHTYLVLIFAGVVIALLEGAHFSQRLRESQRYHRLLLERLEAGQRKNTLLLERLEAEQQKLRRQQSPGSHH